MATLLDELSQLISALDENEIEYAVCGGLALAIHGFARVDKVRPVRELWQN